MKELQHYLEQPFTVVLRRDSEGDFVAKIDELPGCSAHGHTREEALQNLDEAKALWIQDCLENGDPVPVPTEEELLPSGKWLQRVPRKLHRKLQAVAKHEGVSLNQFVTALLAEAVGERRLSATTVAITEGQLKADILKAWHASGWAQLEGLEGVKLRAPERWQVVNVTARAAPPVSGLVERLAQWSSRLPDRFTFKPEKHEKQKHRHSFAGV